MSGDGTVDVALAVVIHDGRVLVAQRAPESHLGGLWEFPGGRIGEGEAPEQAARRELAEETGLSGGEIEPLVTSEHDYPGKSVRLHAFIVRGASGGVAMEGGRAFVWVDPAELASLPMPDANRRICAALARRLSA